MASKSRHQDDTEREAHAQQWPREPVPLCFSREGTNSAIRAPKRYSSEQTRRKGQSQVQPRRRRNPESLGGRREQTAQQQPDTDCEHTSRQSIEMTNVRTD